jgi:hypothetical protein
MTHGMGVILLQRLLHMAEVARAEWKGNAGVLQGGAVLFAYAYTQQPRPLLWLMQAERRGLKPPLFTHPCTCSCPAEVFEQPAGILKHGNDAVLVYADKMVSLHKMLHFKYNDAGLASASTPQQPASDRIPKVSCELCNNSRTVVSACYSRTLLCWDQSTVLTVCRTQRCQAVAAGTWWFRMPCRSSADMTLQ